MLIAILLCVIKLIAIMLTVMLSAIVLRLLC
jgi:hypothetical protein